MKIKKTEALIKYYLNKKSVSSLGGRGAELCGRAPFLPLLLLIELS